MATKHTESVSWIILKDSDGRVFFTSDRGVRINCKNGREAHKAFEKLVSHTMDIVDELLNREFSTIKFHVEF